MSCRLVSVKTKGLLMLNERFGLNVDLLGVAAELEQLERGVKISISCIVEYQAKEKRE
jgi:hypothetical protein